MGFAAMIFSRACEHGLRATIYVAANSQKGGRPLLIREIAAVLDIPTPSLAKVVQRLTRRGLLASQKGPGGGIALARPAERMSLLDVVEAIEDLDLRHACVLGLSGCGERALHCPLHEQWTELREQMAQMLSARSLAALSERVNAGDFLLGVETSPQSRAPSPAREKRTTSK